MLLPSTRARSQTSSVSSRLAAARCPRAGGRLRASAGRRRRTSGSPRPRHPRTRRGAGAPRSAGRRRRCRRARRTRRGCSRVHPRVRRAGETPYDVLEVRLVTDLELDELEVREAITWGWRIERTGATTTRSGPFVGSVPGCLSRRRTAEPVADRVRAWREPLVREGLPGRVVGDGGRVDEVREVGDEVLGLARGGGDGEDRAAGVDETLTTKGRRALGAVRSSARTLPSRASSTAEARTWSRRTTSARPWRLKSCSFGLPDGDPPQAGGPRRGCRTESTGCRKAAGARQRGRERRSRAASEVRRRRPSAAPSGPPPHHGDGGRSASPLPWDDAPGRQHDGHRARPACDLR